MHEPVAPHALDARCAIEVAEPVGHERPVFEPEILVAQRRVASEAACETLKVNGEAFIERRGIVRDAETAVRGARIAVRQRGKQTAQKDVPHLVGEDLLKAAVPHAARIDHEIDERIGHKTLFLPLIQPESAAGKATFFGREIEPGGRRSGRARGALRGDIEREHDAGEAFGRFLLQLVMQLTASQPRDHGNGPALRVGFLQRLAALQHRAENA